MTDAINRCKVLLVGPVRPFRGGIAHFTQSLGEAFSKQIGCQMVSFRRLYPGLLYPGEGSAKDYSMGHIEGVQYRLDSINPLTWRSVPLAANDFDADFVLMPWWTTFLAPMTYSIARSLRRMKIPTYYLIHNVLPHEPRLFDRWLTKRVLGQGSAFMLMSEREVDRLRAVLPVARPVGLYPHPIYNQFDDQKISQVEARVLLGIPQDIPVLLFFGFIRPYKGLLTLIEALRQVLDEGQKARLLIAGEIWGDRSEYFDRIAELGLEADIDFMDRYIPDDEVGRFFSAADIFVAPYLRGTQSGSAKIASSYGLPIIASEQIAEGFNQSELSTVISVPPGESGALANAISSQLRDPRLHTQSVPGNGERADWDGFVQAILELHEEYKHMARKPDP